jgi:RNA polymerase sigma factor (sigma-70 family)
MPARSPSLLDHLRRVTAPPATEAADDAVLLDRFVRLRDGTAFAALVARHGGMVLHVCRRILGDLHAAEDAFQAAFLVLARRAEAIRRRQSLAAWLHAVAYRVAHKARLSAAGRKRREADGPAPEPAAPHTDPLEQMTVRELLAALEEEVRRLPETYRLPVVLCCLEGLSQEEAARRLRCTAGSVRARLERGRKRLHTRLAKRGLTLAAVLGAVEVSRGVAAAVPAALVGTTVQAALTDTLGDAVAAGTVSAATATLTEGVVKAMLLKKLKVAAAVALGVALSGFGVGLLACRALADEPGGGAAAPRGPVQAPPPVKAPAAEGLPGSAMPLPALVRLAGQGRVEVRWKAPTVRYVQITKPDGQNVVVPKLAYVPVSNYCELDALQAFDTTGKELDRKALGRLLKKEVLGLVYYAGQELDPLQLRLFKEGTPVFVLPMPAPPAAAQPPLTAPANSLPAPPGAVLPAPALGPYPGAGPGGTVAPPQPVPRPDLPAPPGGLTPAPVPTPGAPPTAPVSPPSTLPPPSSAPPVATPRPPGRHLPREPGRAVVSRVVMLLAVARIWQNARHGKDVALIPPGQRCPPPEAHTA